MYYWLFLSGIKRKKFKSLNRDDIVFITTKKELEVNYNPNEIDENVKNMKTWRKSLDVIIQNFNEWILIWWFW